MTVRQAGTEDIERQASKQASWLRVKVVDTTGTSRPVNVKVPVRLVSWGMKMARKFSPELKDADLDWDAIGSMIEDGAQGEIVHVEDEEKHQKVEVWVE